MSLDNVKQVLAETELDRGILAALIGCSVATFILVKWVQRRKVKQKIERARAKRDRALREMEQAVLQFKQEEHPDYSRSILALSLRELTEKLKDGSLSPDSVLYTYMEKALEVNKEVNCVTDFLQECQVQLQEVKKQGRGLLYGVPVSLKECVNYKGHDSTCGLVFFLDKPAETDSVITQVLKRQGAIPFVATNIPQTMMSYECSNPIYGQTRNPLNQKKTPGGSSGGEGALIAGGGSVLGIGTDIGGSIRLPASFCGICGLKPTGNRLSNHGLGAPASGIKSVIVSVGPMARDVDSLALCMKALLCEDMFRLDPAVPPLPFNDEVYASTRPLRVGYYESDGYMLPPPSMRRAVAETKRLLEEAGHTLVPFPVPRMEYAFNELIVKGLFADGASSVLEKLKGDIIDPNLRQQIVSYRLPVLVKRILAFIFKPLYPRVAEGFRTMCGIRSVKELWEHHAEIEDYRQEFITEWKKRDLDVMLCPALSPAFNIGYPGKLLAAVCYTIYFNLLDFPAGVVPVTTVTQEDEEELKHHKGYFNDPVDKLFQQAVKGGVGLPVAVQCVALPWQEEQCLRFMREVEELSRKKKRD